MNFLGYSLQVIGDSRLSVVSIIYNLQTITSTSTGVVYE
jgi:hypothetical protein